MVASFGFREQHFCAGQLRRVERVLNTGGVQINKSAIDGRFIDLALRQGTADAATINRKRHERHLIAVDLFKRKIKTEHRCIKSHGAGHVANRDLKIQRRVLFLCHLLPLIG